MSVTKEQERVGMFARVDGRLIKRMKVLAARTGADFQDLVQEALRQFLNNNTKGLDK